MSQSSRIDNASKMAGVMAGIRTAMREAAGAPESEGRKMLVERLNEFAQAAGIKLTAGNANCISKATLDKWLSPTDRQHSPSILAILAFCCVSGSLEPLRVAANALGVDLMTIEDKRLRDYGKAVLDEKAARKVKSELEKLL